MSNSSRDILSGRRRTSLSRPWRLLRAETVIRAATLLLCFDISTSSERSKWTKEATTSTNARTTWHRSLVALAAAMCSRSFIHTREAGRSFIPALNARLPQETRTTCLHIPDYHPRALKAVREGAIFRLADHEIAVFSTAPWRRTKPPCKASPARRNRYLDLFDQDQASIPPEVITAARGTWIGLSTILQQTHALDLLCPASGSSIERYSPSSFRASQTLRLLSLLPKATSNRNA